jgi:glycerate kinase
VRVLIAPDSFTGSMTAAQAANAMAQGWRRTAPGDELVRRPVSDGGPGFLQALADGLPSAQRVAVAAADPWGRPVEAAVLVSDGPHGRTVYVESAQTCGGERRGGPGTASSAGLAPVLRAALAADPARIVVGLGGTLVTDGGAGLLAGLGATATGIDGSDATSVLTGGGAGLSSVSAVALEGVRARFAGVELVAATDVDVPLLGPRGAALGFSPQKGADPATAAVLEESMRSFAHACGRTPDGRSPAVALGAGAAGGLGYALLHLGGQRASGIDLVLEAVGFDRLVAGSDLVLTGEGSFDWQSLSGKVIPGVCRAAAEHGRPVLVLAGTIDVGRREWMAVGVHGAYGILDATDPQAPATDPASALRDAPALLAQVAARAARTWSR